MLLTAVALLSAGAVHGQQMFGGLVVGGTFTDMNGGGFNTGSRWGATIGMVVGRRQFERLAVMIEPAWVQKGGKGVARFDYIEIPLLLGGSLPTPRAIGVLLYSGVSFGVPVGCSSESILIRCGNKSGTEWSWPFGLQLGRPIGRGAGTAIDVRYSLGLTEAFKGQGVKNRGWSFRLVTTFPLGGRRR